jgi:hypothetical protein
MIRQLGAAVTVTVAAVLSAAPAAGAQIAALDVPRLSGIAVDGDTTDWGGRGLRLDLLTPNRPQRAVLEDLDGRVALGWDERGLLVLALVTDEQIVEAEQEGSLWDGDGMELFLAPALGAGDRVQFAVAPGISPAYLAPRWHMYDYRQAAALKGLPGEPTVAARPTAAGYALEVIVPWGPLGIEAGQGRVVAFQFYINDRDDHGFQRLLFFPAENAHGSSLPYRELRLAAAPGSPVRAIERLRLGAAAGAPALLQVQVRHPGPDRAFELAHGRSVLSRAVADTVGPVKTLRFEVPARRLVRAADQLVLRQSGMTVSAVPVDVACLAARPLLDRARTVAAQVAAGPVPKEKERAAALVLA